MQNRCGERAAGGGLFEDDDNTVQNRHQLGSVPFRAATGSVQGRTGSRHEVGFCKRWQC